MSRIVVIPVYEPEECLEELAEQVMDISDELKAKALGYGMKALLETR